MIFHTSFTGFFVVMTVTEPERGQTENRIVKVFKTEGKHVTNGLWAQWESQGELLIAFIISSQIKMSTSMKKAVPLCSLIIRRSILLFHIKQALWNQNDWPEQEVFALRFLLQTFIYSYFLFALLKWLSCCNMSICNI